MHLNDDNVRFSRSAYILAKSLLMDIRTDVSFIARVMSESGWGWCYSVETSCLIAARMEALVHIAQ